MYHLAGTFMRLRFGLLIALLVVGPGFGSRVLGQSCVNLACQQQTCSGTATTTISGTVYAPNGNDPLPNVTVYIPNDVVPAFQPGVTCPVVGAPEPGSPLVGAITDVQGNFTLANVPVGSNIPLVIVSGRWRRQLVIPSITACTNNALPPSFAVMPSNQTEGDIPKIAIATGAVDQVECVLRKMGIDQVEFTNPSGPGRINLYTGTAASGSAIDATTPTQASLMENSTILNSYDVLMLPCQGTPNGNVVSGALGAQELANFINFANSGGRVYSSHYSYAWMFQNPPFDGVVNWSVGQGSPNDGPATVDTSFTAGQTLATWLQEVGASTTLGQMSLNTLRVDTKGVIAPTQSWLTLNSGINGNPHPVMQFVFDTPIAPTGQIVNQCGRVLYNEYHVENGSSSPAKYFPTECVAGAMTPQEKLLEYMLFELTDEGGQASLAPLVQDFGSEAIGFPSAPVTFTWTNNSSFASQVTSANAGGDFAITSNNCTTAPTIAGGASCQITVVFTPTALGARSGTLTVTAQGNTLSASLTGTGTPGYSLSGSTLSFGNLDVGASATQALTLTNIASGPLPVPVFVTTGQYSVSTTACGSTIAAGATCPVNVTFSPTVTGPLSGTLGVNSTNLLYSGLSATMTGNGVDFTLTISPTTGTVIAGDGTSTTATLTPLAGFSFPISLLCQVNAAVASGCGLTTPTFTPTAVTTVTVNMTTTSQYTVIGYGGFGGRGYLWLVGIGSSLLLWRRRRSAGAMLRSGLAVALLAAIGLGMSGCSGKLPAQNATYTAPGSYTMKLTATDGFLVHSATYTLTVTAK
jgi:Abnormal spindle-like microcephaly-assoc'd, ASPM-SPD-2-Hydin